MKRKSQLCLLFLAVGIGMIYYLKKSLAKRNNPISHKPYNEIKQRVIGIIAFHYSSSSFNADTLLTELNEPRDVVESAFEMSIEAIIKQYRVNRAKELLKRTDDSISTIAETIGFLNSSELYQAFEDTCQLTPDVIRNYFSLG